MPASSGNAPENIKTISLEKIIFKQIKEHGVWHTLLHYKPKLIPTKNAFLSMLKGGLTYGLAAGSVIFLLTRYSFGLLPYSLGTILPYLFSLGSFLSFGVTGASTAYTTYKQRLDTEFNNSLNHLIHAEKNKVDEPNQLEALKTVLHHLTLGAEIDLLPAETKDKLDKVMDKFKTTPLLLCPHYQTLIQQYRCNEDVSSQNPNQSSDIKLR